MSSTNGGSSLFLSESTFPNSAYYSGVVTAAAGKGKNVQLIGGSGSGSAKEIYCRVEGDLSVEVVINICVQPGGECSLYFTCIFLDNYTSYLEWF